MAFNTVSQINAAQVQDDVSRGLNLVLATNLLLSNILWSKERFIGDDSMEFKWMEERRNRPSGALAGNYVLASFSIKLDAATAGTIITEDQIHLEGHVDTNGEKIVYKAGTISTDSNPNDSVQLILLRGVDTGYVIGGALTGKVLYTRGILDNALPTTVGVIEPYPRSNFLQLLQDGINVGHKANRLSQSGRMDGFGDPEDAIRRGLSQSMYRMSGFINQAVMNGFGQAEAAPKPAMMQGIDGFMVNATPIDGGGVAITETKINDAIRSMFDAGLPPGSDVMLLCDSVNASNISDFMNDNTSYQDSQAFGTFGSNVKTFVSNIMGMSVGIIPDNSLTTNTIYMISKDWIRLVSKSNVAMPDQSPASVDIGQGGMPAGTAWMVNGTANGQHGTSLTLRVEMSLQMIQVETYARKIIKLTA